MKQTIEDNLTKRKIQIKYNQDNNIIPQTIIKPIPKIDLDLILNSKITKDNKFKADKGYIKKLIKKMDEAAKN